jgi:hypothetical protein
MSESLEATRQAQKRAQARQAFASQHLGLAVSLESASSDASFRSYWRVTEAATPYIVMDAPPEREALSPWLEIAELLRAADVRAPKVVASDRAAGFVLMEDLGKRHYLDVLRPEHADVLYLRAMQAIERMQVGIDPVRMASLPLPDYDEARLAAEMDLFEPWFLGRHLGKKFDAEAAALWHALKQTLIASAREQPQVFVHRDFHSRNLLVLGNPANLADDAFDVGVIDFQDAVRGPITYDLVSLLKDCYIAWPKSKVQAWCEQYRHRLNRLKLTDVGPTRFRRWFDWIGLQRHLKVLGIFARLNYRDGKSRYLADLPLVLSYTLETLAAYGELAPFGEWLRSITARVDITKHAA